MAVFLSRFCHVQRIAVHGIITSIVLLFSQFAHSHTFFESLVDIDTNANSGKLEIVHTYTLHDLTAVLMAHTQLAINLEHPEHEAILRHYIERNFKLRSNGEPIDLAWVGIQINPQNIEIYQESMQKQDLAKLELKQTVLQDSLAKQINRVNFRQGQLQGTLIFTNQNKWQSFTNQD
jgi:hypothetical protein